MPTCSTLPLTDTYPIQWKDNTNMSTHTHTPRQGFHVLKKKHHPAITG